MCNPPYAKCLESHQRCNGIVDCLGAEDEIGCPKDGYYTRFRNPKSQLPRLNIETQTMSTIWTVEEDQRQTTLSSFEEKRKQSAMSKLEKEQSRNMSNTLVSGQVRHSNVTLNTNVAVDDVAKALISKERNERTTTTNADKTTMIPSNQTPNVVTEHSLDPESTIIALAIPDVPQLFICKRYIYEKHNLSSIN
jgi:hypothetical protein